MLSKKEVKSMTYEERVSYCKWCIDINLDYCVSEEERIETCCSQCPLYTFYTENLKLVGI